MQTAQSTAITLVLARYIESYRISLY